MEELLKLAAGYGGPGIIVFAFGWYILHKDKTHRQERREHREALEKQHEEIIALSERQHSETLEVAKNSTSVLTEISTLIKYTKN